MTKISDFDQIKSSGKLFVPECEASGPLRVSQLHAWYDQPISGPIGVGCGFTPYRYRGKQNTSP